MGGLDSQISLLIPLFTRVQLKSFLQKLNGVIIYHQILPQTLPMQPQVNKVVVQIVFRQMTMPADQNFVLVQTLLGKRLQFRICSCAHPRKALAHKSDADRLKANPRSATEKAERAYGDKILKQKCDSIAVGNQELLGPILNTNTLALANRELIDSLVGPFLPVVVAKDVDCITGFEQGKQQLPFGVYKLVERAQAPVPKVPVNNDAISIRYYFDQMIKL